MDNKKIVEIADISEKTPETLRVILMQESETIYSIVVEGRVTSKSEEFTPLWPSKTVQGKTLAYSEYTFMIHQLRYSYHS